MKDYLPFLQNCPLFRGLSASVVLDVLRKADARVESFDANSFVLRAGEKTDSIGLLVSGSALIVQEDIWGRRNLMNKLGVGDFFGEVFALVPDAISSVSVVTTEKTRIIRVNAQRFVAICSTSGESVKLDAPNAPEEHDASRLVRNMLTALAIRVMHLNEKITHMSKRKTRDKLLSYLSAESLRQHSLSFDIPFDRQQLADFLCVERAAMSVELSHLQQEGFLKTDRSHFELNAARTPVDRKIETDDCHTPCC